MIPKIIHFYWGHDQMSFMRYMTFYSFRKFHPDWTMKLYRNPAAAAPRWNGRETLDSLKGQNYMPQLDELGVEHVLVTDDLLGLPIDSVSHVHTKDILNWKILHLEGGVVADNDILFLRPLNSLMEDMKSCSIGLHCFRKQSPGYIPVSFMVGASGAALYAKLYATALSVWDPKIYESAGTPVLNKAYSGWDQLTAEHLCHRLPDETVFPFAALGMLYHEGVTALIKKIVDLDAELDSHADTKASRMLGIHWYGNNPRIKRVVEPWTAESCQEHPSTIAKAVKRVLNS